MEEWRKYLLPLAWFLGSIIAGIIAEKIVLIRLATIARRTKWKGDDIIFGSLRGIVLTWFVLGGFYFAMMHAHPDDQWMQTLNKILLSATVLSIATLTGRILIGLLRIQSHGGRTSPSTSIVSNIIRIIIFLIGILIILQAFGISITPLLTALGVGALAVALALQETLSNLFSGIQIVASQQLKSGDYVKLQSGEEGYVVDITWRNTIIRQLPNNYVIIPNSKIASAIVTNYYLPEKEMAVLVEVGVSYDSDLEKVEKVSIATAREVLQKTTGGVAAFEPFIRYHTFSDSSINFSVIMRGKEFTDQFLIKHTFIKALHRRYKEEGIEIPFPMRTVVMKKEKE